MSSAVGFPAGPFRPGKSREGPGTGRDGTGQDLETFIKVMQLSMFSIQIPRKKNCIHKIRNFEKFPREI